MDDSRSQDHGQKQSMPNIKQLLDIREALPALASLFFILQ